MLNLNQVVDRMRKEALVIKGAPFSFFSVCVLATVVIWYIFNSLFSAKLSNSNDEMRHWHDTAGRWQSDASYWQDMTKRTVYEQQLPGTRSVQGVQRVKPESKLDTSPAQKPRNRTAQSQSLTPAQNETPQISAPNGIAIGGNNVGTATVNNIGSIPRSLTTLQEITIGDAIGSPSSDFDGITCVMGDQEGYQFADQIRKIFDSHGWPNTNGISQAVFNEPLSGVLIAISSGDAASPPAQAMQINRAFQASGIDIHGIKMNGLAHGHFYLLVGNNLSK